MDSVLVLSGASRFARSHNVHFVWWYGYKIMEYLIEDDETLVPPAICKVDPAQLLQESGHTSDAVLTSSPACGFPLDHLDTAYIALQGGVSNS